MSESEILQNNYLARKACLESVLPLLNKSIYGERSKGKGSRYRKKFIQYLKIVASKPFENEEQEYQHINKFGRGFWSEQFIDSFDETEKAIIIHKIAYDFGAFSY